MRFDILNQSGEVINTILADEAFVAEYCAANGYTYAEHVRPTPEPVEPVKPDALTVAEMAAAIMEGVNAV